MKPMDYHQFAKWISNEGYSIISTAKHHAILSPDGLDQFGFAIAHKKGSKRYIKLSYIKQIVYFIEKDRKRRLSS